jgi:predicted porin
MKKTAIIAASIAAVIAGSAVADTTVYGRARMAVQLMDNATGLINDSSRIGFKGSEDLGNGMSAIYHYEMGYNADDTSGTIISNRIGVVGLKGDFGTVAVGNMWVPAYNMAAGTLDPFNHFGLDDGYQLGARSGDAIAYINKIGAADVQFALVSSDTTDDLNDGYNLGVSFPAGPVTVGFGMHNDTNDSGMVVVVNYKGDGFTVGGGLSDAEDLGGDTVTTLLGTFNTGSGQILARWSSVDVADISGTTIGYHHNLSKRT